MYRRDYIMKMLEEAARVFAKIIGLKEEGEYEKVKQVLEEAYRDLLKNDSLTIKKNSSSLDELRKKFNFSDEHLEILARLYYEESEIAEEKEALVLLQNAKGLLLHLNEVQKMYSIEREDLIQQITNEIELIDRKDTGLSY